MARHEDDTELASLHTRTSFESDDGPSLKPSSPAYSPRQEHGHSRSTSLAGSDHTVLGFVPPVLPSAIAPTRIVDSDSSAGRAEEKHLGLIGAVALVVGSQLGSGIFSSPGVILASTTSIGASLLIWFLGGLLAWTGASSYAELGSAIPVDGGSQAYLGYAYGPLASYLYTFTTVVALKPGSAAIIALVFGEYAARLIYLILPLSSTTTSESTATSSLDIPTWLIKLLACVAIVGTSVLSALNAKSGIRAAVALTGIKVASLIFVLLLGLISLLKNGIGPNFGTVGLFEGTSDNPAAYAVALYSGLWAYDGWDNSNLVAGQMINAARDLPRCIHISLSTMIILYLLTNIAYFLVLPLDVISVSNTIALDFGHEVLGRAGGLVFTVVVGTSCFGALNGGVYTSARLIYAAAQESFLPSAFGRLSESRQTPINAIALNMTLCLIFVIFGGGFRSMVSFFGVIAWVFYLATVSGLLYLRVKEPQLKRPYQAWIITPIIFCGVALFLLLMPAIADPLQALAAFGFIIAGLPAYYLTLRYKGSPTRPDQEYHPLSTMARIRSLAPECQIAAMATVARPASCLCLVALPKIFNIAAFDSSVTVLGSASSGSGSTPANWESFLRWDGLFFADIAQNGYRFEQPLAFFPAWPAIMRLGGSCIARLRSLVVQGGSATIGDIVVGGTIVANLIFVLNSVMLYRLSLSTNLGAKRSIRAAMLYTLGPAPAVMSSPYTEQLFALCSFTGFWLLQRRNGWPRLTQLLASVVLAVASGTRSLGILGSVAVVWTILAIPYIQGERRLSHNAFNLIWSGVLCLIVAAPFATFQLLAYLAFCGTAIQAEAPEWCQQSLPLAYSAVQAKYWNIGFLRYWQLAQIPNFVLAGPVLAVCIYAIYLYSDCPRTAITCFAHRRQPGRHIAAARDLAILPHYVIHAITTFVLIFASHTQIALRVCSGMPLVWWTLAEVCFEPDAVVASGDLADGAMIKDVGRKVEVGRRTRLTRVGRAWLTWVCVWGGISLVLWSGFYPPA